jgi:3-oxoacyl-[acyl-carrier protein] reductase
MVLLWSRGWRRLGRAIARRLGRDGWAVVVNDIDDTGVREVADAIEHDGGRALAVTADATDSSAVAEMVATARIQLGPVLVTVANASGPQGDVTIDELTWEYMLGHLEFFAKSPLALLHAALPDMRAAGWGRVVHVGSDMFDQGAAGWSAYMAGKGALVGLTRGWAMELGRDGITVNLVAPGWIPVGRHGIISVDVEEDRLARQSVPRWGTPDEVADAVAYLVSDGAGFVSGQRLVVNGVTHFG